MVIASGLMQPSEGMAQQGTEVGGEEAEVERPEAVAEEDGGAAQRMLEEARAAIKALMEDLTAVQNDLEATEAEATTLRERVSEAEGVAARRAAARLRAPTNRSAVQVVINLRGAALGFSGIR